MAEAWENYTNLVADETGLLGCWPPGGELSLGDIVRMEKKRTPVRQMSFSDLGLELALQPGKNRRDIGVSSGAGIKVDGAAGASAPVHPGVAAGAEVLVSFSRANAVLMRAEDCQIDQLDRLDLARREILERNARKEWNPDWLVISQVGTAKRLLVLISKSAGAKAAVKISGDVEATPVSLAKGQGRVSLVHNSESVYSEVSDDPTTPLYRALKLRERTLREDKVAQTNKRGRARPAPEEFDVVEFRY